MPEIKEATRDVLVGMLSNTKKADANYIRKCYLAGHIIKNKKK